MRYDFGGGCREYAYDEEITIVDITPMENCENVSSEGCDFGPPKKCKSDKYIVADIFSKDLILPEKADFINASQVLRYFAGQYDGYLDSNSIDNDKLKVAAQNIINNLNDGVSSTIVRWHDSGDFFSEQYMKLAFEVAVKTEFAEHYAYTKEVGMAKRIQRPSNFEFKFSYGGEEDSLIDPNVDGHAHIVPKKLFGDLQPDEDKVNQKGVHYVGKGWNFAPEVINIIKDRLAEAYHIDRNRIITVSELKRIPYNRNGAVRKWYVIGKSGDSDISALRRDVLGIYLLQHK